MRATLLLVSVLVLAGCPSSGAVVTPDLAAAACSKDCASQCGGSQQCIHPGSLSEFQGFCANTCTVTSDCGAAARCIKLFNEPTVPRVCVTSTSPMICPGVAVDPSWHCDFPLAQCSDAHTLARSFSQPANRVCGTEYIFCPAGCRSADTDGGTAAACN